MKHAVYGRTATMPAVIYTGSNIAFAQRPNPVFSHDCNVLIRVVATGICGTDRSIALGLFPAAPGVILGHEAVGDVVAVNPGLSSIRPGERVVINPTFYCLQCRYCRRGMMAHCPAKEGREVGVDRDGTLTDFIAMPERFVHRIPDEMSYRRAALVEPLACVINNVMAANPRWDDRILVLGAGPIGALCALAGRDSVCSRLQRYPSVPRVAEVNRSGGIQSRSNLVRTHEAYCFQSFETG